MQYSITANSLFIALMHENSEKYRIPLPRPDHVQTLTMHVIFTLFVLALTGLFATARGSALIGSSTCVPSTVGPKISYPNMLLTTNKWCVESKTIEESGSFEGSSDNVWWVNSGATFHIENGIGKTLHGKLPETSLWRGAYASSNPIDTENGYRPQNIFRLLTKKAWGDLDAKIYVNIVSYNDTNSANRNSSNGIFILGRYQDHNTAYLAGIRVDGAAVIKKKQQGRYTTLAYSKEWQNEEATLKENVLPENTWIGMRSTIETKNDGGVRITLLLDKNGSGIWTETLDITDYGNPPHESPILLDGHAGIRTDFIDAEFRDLSFTSL